MEVRITKLRMATGTLFVLAGVGLGSLLSPLVGSALANVGQVVNISDHSGSAYFAKVDSTGKLAVGDGAGPLSVDGTVSGRPAAPASPWHASGNPAGSLWLAGPTASPINVTSISISTDAPDGEGLQLALRSFVVPISATTIDDCNFNTPGAQLWFIRDLGDGITPLSFTFPTPLQYRPPANSKACLLASASAGTLTITMNAVGFYGG
jgi:hypothetical protein